MPHDRGVWQYVAEHQGAIGYGALAYQDDRAKLVALDDVLPTANDVRRQPLRACLSPRGADSLAGTYGSFAPWSPMP